MTLLELVQDILSEMKSDNVNSISDTEEASIVAGVIRNTYFEIVNNRLYPTQGSLFRLTASTDNTKPTHMRIEDDVADVDWVKYDVRRAVSDPIKYRDIPYKCPADFLDHVMQRDASKGNVQTVFDYAGTPILVLTDAAPSFWTSFDDRHLVFDSFDSTVDSTLQNSKTQVFGTKEPSFQLADNFTPELPSKAFPYLLAEAKSTCMLNIKEVFSQKTEQSATRQRSWLSRNKRRMAGGIKFPDYGRK
jgi:hypothetical protein